MHDAKRKQNEIMYQMQAHEAAAHVAQMEARLAWEKEVNALMSF